MNAAGAEVHQQAETEGHVELVRSEELRALSESNGRYAARLREFVENWPGKGMADIMYMTGRKARRWGRPGAWLFTGLLLYPGQRLVRLGYADEANGLPNRLEVEDWRC